MINKTDYSEHIFATITLTLGDHYEKNSKYRAFRDKLDKFIEEIPNPEKREELHEAIAEFYYRTAEVMYKTGLKDARQNMAQLMQLLSKGAKVS